MPKEIKLKTTKNKASVQSFLNTIEDPEKREDAKTVCELMREVTKEKPTMWGDSIVGFGTYTYTRSSGDYGEFMRTGFSPRKNALTLYIMPGYQFPEYTALLKKLGPHTLGKSCLYIKRLSDIDLPTLKKIITKGWKDMERYST